MCISQRAHFAAIYGSQKARQTLWSSWTKRAPMGDKMRPVVHRGHLCGQIGWQTRTALTVRQNRARTRQGLRRRAEPDGAAPSQCKLGKAPDCAVLREAPDGRLCAALEANVVFAVRQDGQGSAMPRALPQAPNARRDH